ncbi:MAG: T9SS type A sorting domain-containing protein, partial [Flavobacteriales bacterium]
NTTEVCDTVYVHAADVLYNIPERIRVKDPYNSMFVLGLNGGLGVWMTREALNFNTTPSWIRIAEAPAGFSGTKAIEFVEQGEEAGDVMFYTGWNGQVTRVTGLRNVYSQEDVSELEVTNILSSAGAAVTGLSVDPNDPNHVVISVGGYGANGAGKVRETFNALSDDVEWDNIWTGNGPNGLGLNFNNIPCYDVVIDANDPSTIVVGTEFGIFVKNGDANWEISNIGMENGPDGVTAPVFDLKQQFRSSHPWSNITNGGAIYAGTHGRGIFVNGIASDVEEEELVAEEATWNVFPNPVVGEELNLPTAGWQGQARVEIFDLTGRRWVNDVTNVGGVDRVRTDVRELPSGYYVVRMSQGDAVKAAKFVVRR